VAVQVVADHRETMGVALLCRKPQKAHGDSAPAGSICCIHADSQPPVRPLSVSLEPR
jgi:hypothetical protein